MKTELRGRCPSCKNVRVVWGYIIDNPTPSALDALEDRVDAVGGVHAICPRCTVLEEVAFFVDGAQQEEWLNADEYERRNGPNAGPLPPKPW